MNVPPTHIGPGVNREAIYAAFFETLRPLVQAPQGGSGVFPQLFTTVSRRYWGVDKLALESYPALFLVESGEVYHREVRNVPAKVELMGKLVIVTALNADSDADTASDLNVLADAVDAAITQISKALGGGAYGGITLGGLVSNLYLSGRTVDIVASGSNFRSLQELYFTIVTTQVW